MARDTPVAVAEVEIKVEQRRSGEPAMPLPPPPSQQRRPPQLCQVQPFGQWAAWLVPVIVVANVAVFIATMYVNNCPASFGRTRSCVGRRLLGRFAFEPIKSNPLLGPSSNTLEKMGALDVTKVVLQHQWWRLIACIWLHAGVVHIVTNMLSLLFIGIRLEQEFGFVRIGLLYVISGFGGSLLSALFIRSNISVGASGAVFGLLGGMLSELITNWTIYANKIAALLTLVFIIAINLAFGLLPHVDNFAHIGGFISGFFLGFVFLIRPQFGWIRQKNIPPGYHTSPVKHKHKMYQYILWIISVLFLIFWFTIGLIMLFRGVNANDHCSWCQYLSCLPTSRWSCNPSATSCLISRGGNELTISCEGDGRSQSFPLPNATDEQLRELCGQVCG